MIIVHRLRRAPAGMNGERQTNAGREGSGGADEEIKEVVAGMRKFLTRERVRRTSTVVTEDGTEE